jgi:hypothetical protein
MALKEKWRSKHYDVLAVEARFVRTVATWGALGAYEFCETAHIPAAKGWRRFDIRQGFCDAEDLPDDVRAKADALAGMAWRYVDWPPV